jgi:hypothetical protein
MNYLVKFDFYNSVKLAWQFFWALFAIIFHNSLGEPY